MDEHVQQVVTVLVDMGLRVVEVTGDRITVELPPLRRE